MEKKYKQEATSCVKVVFYGPESTGKTTLARSLAMHYKTEFVPEFAREYLQEIWDNEMRKCQKNDLPKIAKGQIELENRLAKKASKILFCDTNLLQYIVYSKVYFNQYFDNYILQAALSHHYDLCFLTQTDVPWVSDDLRDKPHDRNYMYNQFKNTLISNEIPFYELNGNLNQRKEKAIFEIKKLLATNDN